MYLAPEHRATPILPNRSGLSFTKTEPAAFDILLVQQRSAATAAGIVAGDRIAAIDGRSADEVSRADLLGIVTQARGAIVRLRILHSGAAKDVTLTLH
jgi:C-terminal processing protease CtpA/Prc